MAKLAAPLPFPLGGQAPVSSGRINGPPFGAPGGGIGGAVAYFNPAFPPGAPYAYDPPGSQIFVRFMATPLVDGATVVDIVMPQGWNNTDSWYVVLYTMGGGTLT